MKRRILTAAILIPFVLASILFFPLVLFLLLLDLLLFLALREFSRMASAAQVSLFRVTYVLGLLLPWFFRYASQLIIPYMLGTILIVLGCCVFCHRDVNRAFSQAAGNLLSLCYLAFPISLIGRYHAQGESEPGGPSALIMVLILVWISDSAAYLVGRAIGRHKITPAISPNKTLEGFAAAILFPLLAAPLLIGQLAPNRTLLFLLVAALVVALASLLGDLFESLLKRGAEIKDTSGLIPGHGGILDRIDSLLFALPAYYLLTVFWI